MALTQQNTTIDCANAATVGAFWAAALERPLTDDTNQYFAMIPARGPHELTWLFLQVPEAKTAKNRMHVDFAAADREAEVTRLIELGAERVGDHDQYGIRWTTLRDVEGNEFCVAQHQESPGS